ncbi:hypothetical protein LCI18_014079 [Fusarium solani-melongenae]|uniref:Uncharacterized protein n=1 Tax=Fusarium solani subsp. cucurbitae TaxID=2747967 RepID=A0ACD3ZPC9_FUSSC|nr:hypothetical protein LCI18_014079 [Fusarium solani-melongenae]
MSTVRQKRKSCEACRKRKLRCSGQDTGCSRCVSLGLVCIFHEKGLPGRPRKWSLNEAGEPQRHQPNQVDQQDNQIVVSDTQPMFQQEAETPSSNPTPSTVSAEASSVVASGSTDIISSVPQDWNPEERDDVSIGHEDFGSLPLLHFDSIAQLDALPLDSFRACLSPAVRNGEPVELSPNASVISTVPPKSCNCSKQVFEIIRSLERTPVSHGTLHILRQGVELFEKLLTCPICYDMSKPPRITLQNVILLGRLSLEVTSGYHKYLEWVKEYCKSLAERKMSDTVYLVPGDEISSRVGFELSSDKFFELVIDGLHNDVQKLLDLGSRFATRQYNRHLIGHEACPDWEGRCWKEKLDVDPDPSDVCPQSPAARALTPCYRIVDEVRAKIKQFEDDIT